MREFVNEVKKLNAKDIIGGLLCGTCFALFTLFILIIGG